MGRVIDMDTILIYKRAAKKLEECKMRYDKNKLIGNPELCREILSLIEYYELLQIK